MYSTFKHRLYDLSIRILSHRRSNILPHLNLKLYSGSFSVVLLMDKILHDLKDSKLWELWYIPYNG